MKDFIKEFLLWQYRPAGSQYQAEQSGNERNANPQ